MNTQGSKWPNSLTLVRHIQSGFQQLKLDKANDPLHKQLKRAYALDPNSKVTQSLARQVWEKYPPSHGDHNTPTTAEGQASAVAMAQALKERIMLPDVIYVSPYGRTWTTLEHMKKGWPELKEVKTYEDYRLRELDHGLASIYNDWRVFFALHPEQRMLHRFQGDYWYRWPQGENVPDVQFRARSLNDTFMREFAEQNILVVSHHLYILAAMANYLRWTDKKFLWYDKYRKPVNAGVTLFNLDPAKGKRGRLALGKYNLKLY